MKLTLAEAVLGGQVAIPTLDGQVALKIPPGTQPGERRVMQGRGIKAADGSISQVNTGQVNTKKHAVSRLKSYESHRRRTAQSGACPTTRRRR